MKSMLIPHSLLSLLLVGIKTSEIYQKPVGKMRALIILKVIILTIFGLICGAETRLHERECLRTATCYLARGDILRSRLLPYTHMYDEATKYIHLWDKFVKCGVDKINDHCAPETFLCESGLKVLAVGGTVADIDINFMGLIQRADARGLPYLLNLCVGLQENHWPEDIYEKLSRDYPQHCSFASSDIKAFQDYHEARNKDGGGVVKYPHEWKQLIQLAELYANRNTSHLEATAVDKAIQDGIIQVPTCREQKNCSDFNPLEWYVPVHFQDNPSAISMSVQESICRVNSWIGAIRADWPFTLFGICFRGNRTSGADYRINHVSHFTTKASANRNPSNWINCSSAYINTGSYINGVELSYEILEGKKFISNSRWRCSGTLKDTWIGEAQKVEKNLTQMLCPHLTLMCSFRVYLSQFTGGERMTGLEIGCCEIPWSMFYSGTNFVFMNANYTTRLIGSEKEDYKKSFPELRLPSSSTNKTYFKLCPVAMRYGIWRQGVLKELDANETLNPESKYRFLALHFKCNYIDDYYVSDLTQELYKPLEQWTVRDYRTIYCKRHYYAYGMQIEEALNTTSPSFHFMCSNNLNDNLSNPTIQKNDQARTTKLTEQCPPAHGICGLQAFQSDGDLHEYFGFRFQLICCPIAVRLAGSACPGGVEYGFTLTNFNGLFLKSLDGYIFNGLHYAKDSRSDGPNGIPLNRQPPTGSHYPSHFTQVQMATLEATTSLLSVDFFSYFEADNRSRYINVSWGDTSKYDEPSSGLYSGGLDGHVVKNPDLGQGGRILWLLSNAYKVVGPMAFAFGPRNNFKNWINVDPAAEEEVIKALRSKGNPALIREGLTRVRTIFGAIFENIRSLRRLDDVVINLDYFPFETKHAKQTSNWYKSSNKDDVLFCHFYIKCGSDERKSYYYNKYNLDPPPLRFDTVEKGFIAVVPKFIYNYDYPVVEIRYEPLDDLEQEKFGVVLNAGTTNQTRIIRFNRVGVRIAAEGPNDLTHFLRWDLLTQDILAYGGFSGTINTGIISSLLNPKPYKDFPHWFQRPDVNKFYSANVTLPAGHIGRVIQVVFKRYRWEVYSEVVYLRSVPYNKSILREYNVENLLKNGRYYYEVPVKLE